MISPVNLDLVVFHCNKMIPRLNEAKNAKTFHNDYEKFSLPVKGSSPDVKR